jgi:NADH:ubiquinone oxidoreductase subunit K
VVAFLQKELRHVGLFGFFAKKTIFILFFNLEIINNLINLLMASNNSKNDLKIIYKKKILEPNVVKNVSSTKNIRGEILVLVYT